MLFHYQLLSFSLHLTLTHLDVFKCRIIVSQVQLRAFSVLKEPILAESHHLHLLLSNLFPLCDLVLHLFGYLELDSFVVHLEPNHLEGAHLNVKVCEPLIDVATVLFLNVLEFVCAIIHFTVHQWDLEFSLIYLEVAIDKRESTPSHYIVFCSSLRRHPNQLENNHIRRLKVEIRRNYKVHFVAIKI